MKKIKRIGTDLAGYGLILLGLATGWLPGPGGIPLILAGLGILSINNHWAKRLLHYIGENGSKLMKLLFPDNKWVQIAHDVLVVALLGGALYLLLYQRNVFTIGACIALVALATADFLYNRNRFDTFKQKTK